MTSIHPKDSKLVLSTWENLKSGSQAQVDFFEDQVTVGKVLEQFYFFKVPAKVKDLWNMKLKRQYTTRIPNLLQLDLVFACIDSSTVELEMHFDKRSALLKWTNNSAWIPFMIAKITHFNVPPVSFYDVQFV